ncbi:MAG TPA: ankyrin repeat domain-containing protein [Methylomirabilota bacterium]|nr:ankyrin repeat domain-containing protein [Methylomirabilota bacterium]
MRHIGTVRRQLIPPLTVLVLASGCGRFGVDQRDEHAMTALMRAARDGNLAETRRLVSNGADVNAEIPTRDLRELIAFISWMQQLPHWDIGYRPLHYAAQGGNTDLARLLIEKGARVGHVARGGETALDVAVTRSKVPMATLLIDSGARPGDRQLSFAVGLGTPEMARLLIERGASVNPSPPAVSYVIMAARRGHPAMLELLIDAGADVKAQDQNGWSALRWARHLEARRRPHEASLAPIIARLEVAGARDDTGAKAAALFDAVLGRDAAAVRRALAAGADPNAKDDRGVPPLIYAGNLGQAEIVAALVDAGAEVNASPQNDTTPLIAAVTGGSREAVEKLLAAGARVDQPDRLQRTALQAASNWGRNEIAALLLESAAPADPRALAIAALRGNADQVRGLLSRGADANADRGHALAEAARGCQRRDNTEVIRLLLEGGARPMADDTGYTALHRAAGLCPVEAVRLLLARGADPNARDLNRVTPLISAATMGRLENVRALIAARADVNVRDGDGKSVLDYAARSPEVQEELRRAGAR